MAAYNVKVFNGALDDFNGNIALRGVIDPGSFLDLKIGDYQREEARLSTINKYMKALENHERLPDIEIGIRGSGFREREGAFYINHDCYIIDGQQRLASARRYLAGGLDREVRIGALLHFGTTEKWEMARFEKLNADRLKVSVNVLIRNTTDSPVVKTLLSMTKNDKEFVLREKVSWNQNMARGELMPVFMLMKVIGVLHAHFGPGMSTNRTELVKSMDKTFGVVGVNIWRANIRSFYDVIDQAFGIKTIAYRDMSPHIRGTFMFTLAKVFADHQTFWDGARLEVARHDIEKLRSFPINDPGILALIGGGGSKVHPLLYMRLIQHMNSGRRTRRITQWNGQPASDFPVGGETDDFEEDAGTVAMLATTA